MKKSGNFKTFSRNVFFLMKSVQTQLSFCCNNSGTHFYFVYFYYHSNMLDTQRSPGHLVGMHCISNRDIHLYPPRNQSVLLSTTLEVQRSGRIIDWMRSGWTTLRDPRHQHPKSWNSPAKNSVWPAEPSHKSLQKGGFMLMQRGLMLKIC